MCSSSSFDYAHEEMTSDRIKLFIFIKTLDELSILRTIGMSRNTAMISCEVLATQRIEVLHTREHGFQTRVLYAGQELRGCAHVLQQLRNASAG